MSVWYGYPEYHKWWPTIALYRRTINYLYALYELLYMYLGSGDGRPACGYVGGYPNCLGSMIIPPAPTPRGSMSAPPTANGSVVSPLSCKHNHVAKEMSDNNKFYNMQTHMYVCHGVVDYLPVRYFFEICLITPSIATISWQTSYFPLRETTVSCHGRLRSRLASAWGLES